MINTKIKKILSNKFISLGIIPFFLIMVWFTLSLIFNNKISFSVLLYPQSNTEITALPNGLLLKNQKIRGSFRAKDNYLGLIMVRFAEYGKHDFNGEDLLIFRIKPEGEKNWSFSNTYRSGLLENNLLFPFGFPIIYESRNKVYEFEIESLLGNKTNGVEISRNTTALFSGYQYPKSEILQTKKSSIKFIIKKITTSFTNLDFLLSSILYLLPLLIYLGTYFFSSANTRLNNYKQLITLCILVLILTDLFKIKEIYNGLLITLILSWVFMLIINKKGSKYSFMLAIVLIFLWVIFIALDIKVFQNKLNVWVYALFVTGLIQAVIEEKYNNKKIKKN